MACCSHEWHQGNLVNGGLLNAESAISVVVCLFVPRSSELVLSYMQHLLTLAEWAMAVGDHLTEGPTNQVSAADAVSADTLSSWKHSLQRLLSVLQPGDKVGSMTQPTPHSQQRCITSACMPKDRQRIHMGASCPRRYMYYS